MDPQFDPQLLFVVQIKTNTVLALLFSFLCDFDTLKFAALLVCFFFFFAPDLQCKIMCVLHLWNECLY